MLPGYGEEHGKCIACTVHVCVGTGMGRNTGSVYMYIQYMYNVCKCVISAGTTALAPFLILQWNLSLVDTSITIILRYPNLIRSCLCINICYSRDCGARMSINRCSTICICRGGGMVDFGRSP